MDIYVQSIHNMQSRAYITIGQHKGVCAIGKSGSASTGRNESHKKREGDGATPQGRFALRRLWYRPDREARPQSPLPITALTPQSGWSDDPCDPAYNRPINLPHLQNWGRQLWGRQAYPFSHERLWRKDHLYNLFFELGYNDAPIIKNGGSAIFLHLAYDDLRPTQGCVAVSRALMAQIIAHATPKTFIEIA